MKNINEELEARREAAVRLPGGDPLFPGRRFHRPTLGHRASGYREGYLAALRFALQEISSHPSDIVIAKLAAIVKRGDDAK